MRIDTPKDMPTHLLENPEQFDFQVTHLEIGWDYERMEHAQIVDSTGSGLVSYRSLQIYLSCENTIRWMLDNGLMIEDYSDIDLKTCYGDLIDESILNADKTIAAVSVFLPAERPYSDSIAFLNLENSRKGKAGIQSSLCGYYLRKPYGDVCRIISKAINQNKINQTSLFCII